MRGTHSTLSRESGTGVICKAPGIYSPVLDALCSPVLVFATGSVGSRVNETESDGLGALTIGLVSLVKSSIELR